MMEQHLIKILQNKHLKKVFFEFKKIIIEIFGKAYDFNNFSVKKYSENKYWYDSVHPTELLSDIMTRNIFVIKNKKNIVFPTIIVKKTHTQ